MMEPDLSELVAPPTPARPVSRGMPRPAILAIALSGLFCGLMTCFLVYFAASQGFAPFFIWLNVFTAAFLFGGSLWMLAKLRH